MGIARRRRLGLLVLLATLAGWSATAHGSEQPLPAWMTGAWQLQATGDNWGDEHWTPPRAGIMIGAARTGRGERLELFEHSRIVRGEDGTLIFVAQPRGAPPSEFPAVASGPQSIEFANPAHDYPQRIRYWREGVALKARISRMDGSRSVDFAYLPMSPPLPKPKVGNRPPRPQLDPR